MIGYIYPIVIDTENCVNDGDNDNCAVKNIDTNITQKLKFIPDIDHHFTNEFSMDITSVSSDWNGSSGILSITDPVDNVAIAVNAFAPGIYEVITLDDNSSTIRL